MEYDRPDMKTYREIQHDIFENILDNIRSFNNDNILHNDSIGIMCVFIYIYNKIIYIC